MKTHHPLSKLSLVAALALGVSSMDSRATLVAYEAFDQDAGTNIAGLTNSSLGFTGTYRDSGAFEGNQAGSLSYSTLTTSGNRYKGFSDGGAMFLDFATTYGTTTSTYYLSVLVQAGSGNAYKGFQLNQGSDDDANAKMMIGALFGTTEFALNDNPTSTSYAIAGSNSADVNFAVLKFQFDTSGNDTVSLFLNPSLASEPGTASASFTAADLSFDRIRLASFGGSGGLTIDEIRLGTTYADVTPVPEPSIIALLTTVGAMGVVFLRRRS